jgi:hypothetical protein
MFLLCVCHTLPIFHMTMTIKLYLSEHFALLTNLISILCLDF